jgi:hypothetical protein
VRDDDMVMSSIEGFRETRQQILLIGRYFWHDDPPQVRMSLNEPKADSQCRRA